MPTVSKEGSVYFLNLGDGENRFTLPWITELHAVVQEIAAGQGPRAIVTLATGKFWSNGLDLDWLISHPDEGADYIDLVQEIFASFIELPLPTVAAIQGHCYAAGALLAMSHDFALMRSDRGFFCLPEVDLGIPFSPGMSSLLQSRMLPATAHEAMVTGRRYGGEEAAQAGIVKEALSDERLLAAATELAESLAGKAGPTMAALRQQMYRDTIRLLRLPTKPISM